MVPTAVRGPVVGPASRACASESERVRTAGVSAAMTGHFKVNGVGTLWLPGNDKVMAKEVGAVMIVWGIMAWYGDSRGF